MAVKLDKDILRESTTEVDGKAVNVKLTKNQEIELKLKGKRSGAVTISVKDLWNHLNGVDESSSKGGLVETTRRPVKRGGNKMISLNDLRSANAISTLDYATMAKFDGIIKEMIDNLK